MNALHHRQAQALVQAGVPSPMNLSMPSQAQVCWVQVLAIEGSTPREVGACMQVWPMHTEGSIGGGHVEWDATARARAWLHQQGVQVALPGDGAPAPVPPPEALPRGVRGFPAQSPPSHASVRHLRYALGPALGQCCGGVMLLGLELMTAHEAQERWRSMPAHRHPVVLFGGGHVGQAVVRVLQPLPFAVTWLDSREDIGPSACPPGVRRECVDPLADAVPDLPAASQVLIMTHHHEHDFQILMACLHRQRQRGDLAWLGLIGSRTKWARFQHRLRDRGFTAQELSRVACPVGVPGITGKAPDIIAIAIAAQLLQGISDQHGTANPPAPSPRMADSFSKD